MLGSIITGICLLGLISALIFLYVKTFFGNTKLSVVILRMGSSLIFFQLLISIIYLTYGFHTYGDTLFTVLILSLPISVSIAVGLNSVANLINNTQRDSEIRVENFSVSDLEKFDAPMLKVNSVEPAQTDVNA